MLSIQLLWRTFFIKKNWTCVLLWGHWYPYFGLLVTSALGFKARVDFWLVCFLAYTYYSSDSPLVWHLPTSWRAAQRLVAFRSEKAYQRTKKLFIDVIKMYVYCCANVTCEVLFVIVSSVGFLISNVGTARPEENSLVPKHLSNIGLINEVHSQTDCEKKLCLSFVSIALVPTCLLYTTTCSEIVCYCKSELQIFFWYFLQGHCTRMIR